MPSARISPLTDTTSASSEKCLDTSCRDAFLFRDDSSEEQKKDEAGQTPFERVVRKLHNDEKWLKEVSLGKRVGFYRLRGELGTGSFSQVKWAVHCLTNERVAVKILDKSKLDRKTQRMLSREIISMETLHHPHVIRLFEVVETISKIYLVMEHAGGGELFYKISMDGRFNEHDAKPLFAQITDAVEHMHMHNIIHRDLKAENVFFSAPGHVKVGDFGFSTQVRYPGEALKTFCGSPPYAAPELFQDDSYTGPAVDVWALGVLLYFMLTASMPFKSQTVSGLKKLIIEGHFTIPDYVSMDCQCLIYGLLRKNPYARMSVEQMKKSRWFTGLPPPAQLPKYSIRPPSLEKDPPSTLSPEELVAREKLIELGVTENMVMDSWDRGVKSNVTGTYRIMLHHLLNPTVYDDTISTSSDPENTSVNSLRKENGMLYRQRGNKKSRTCTIL